MKRNPRWSDQELIHVVLANFVKQTSMYWFSNLCPMTYRQWRRQGVAGPGGQLPPMIIFFLLVSSAVGHGYDINNVGPRPTNFVCTTSAAQRCHMGCGASRLHAGSPAKSSYIQEHGYSQSSSSQSSAVVPLLRKRALVIASNLHS